MGTMRGVQPPPPPDPWVVDIGRSGDHCVPAKGPVRLWRAKKDKARILSLKNLGDKSKSVTDWPAGSSALAWPAEVTLGNGARYLLRLKGSRARRKFNLHLVPAGLPTDAHRAAWMAKKGCETQEMRLLSRLRCQGGASLRFLSPLIELRCRRDTRDNFWISQKIPKDKIGVFRNLVSRNTRANALHRG